MRSEDASQWQTEPHPYFTNELMLAHKPNGDCIYLEDGCGIYDKPRPQQCIDMDCRNIARSIGYTKGRKLKGRYKELYRQGRKLIASSS